MADRRDDAAALVGLYDALGGAGLLEAGVRLGPHRADAVVAVLEAGA
ncbi:hypothetical protein [Streptomyces sp. NPDC002185]